MQSARIKYWAWRSIVCLAISCVAVAMLLSTVAIHQLQDTLESLHITIRQIVEPYEKILQGARWPIQRYEYQMRNGGSINAAERQTITSISRQLVYGMDYEYFLLRSISGKIKVGLNKGSVLERSISASIFGENEFIHMPSGFFIRPCTIESKFYLCLISTGLRHTFATEDERLHSIIAMNPQSILQHLTHTTRSSFSIIPPLILSARLANQIYSRVQ